MPTTVLIAEDEPHILTLLRFKLRDAGFDVIPADDGLKALDLARTHKPDIILLDVMMPLVNGYQVLETLRKDAELNNTPVIMLTAKSLQREIDEAMAKGATDYIVKPFNPADLIERIQQILGKR